MAKKITSADMKDAGTPVVKKDEKSETDESESLRNPDASDTLLDFNESVAEEVKPFKAVIEVEGDAFELDKIRDSTRKYISAVSIGTGNEAKGTLMICKKLLAKHERQRFEEWYYDQLIKITEEHEDWEDKDWQSEEEKAAAEPISIDDWFPKFLDGFMKAMYKVLGVDNPKG